MLKNPLTSSRHPLRLAMPVSRPPPRCIPAHCCRRWWNSSSAGNQGGGVWHSVGKVIKLGCPRVGGNCLGEVGSGWEKYSHHRGVREQPNAIQKLGPSASSAHRKLAPNFSPVKLLLIRNGGTRAPQPFGIGATLQWCSFWGMVGR